MTDVVWLLVPLWGAGALFLLGADWIGQLYTEESPRKHRWYTTLGVALVWPLWLPFWVISKLREINPRYNGTWPKP